MTMATISSRDFNQNGSQAKKASDRGPVFITDRGRPAHVLLSIDDHRRLTGSFRKTADALAMLDREDIEFNPLRATIEPQATGLA